MKRYLVCRLNTSPYHSKEFASTERDRIQQATGLTYVDDLNLLSEEKFGHHSLLLITNTHTKLSQIPRDWLKHTELIIHSNSGYDNLASEAELWAEIPVIVGHEIRAAGVTEYCLQTVLLALQKLPFIEVWDKSRNWPRQLVQNTPIWIFGKGHIGSSLASVLKALGAKVTTIDPYSSADMKYWTDGDISEAKVVIVCCSLNPSSYHLFNANFFQKAHSELIFINGARGQLVDETALTSFLKSNPKAKAFLDVFENEPFDDSWSGKTQVYKTSHIAGVSQELDNLIIDFELKVLEDFFKYHPDEFKIKYKNQLLNYRWQNGILI